MSTQLRRRRRSRHCGASTVGWRRWWAWHLCTRHWPSGMAARAGPWCLTSSWTGWRCAAAVVATSLSTFRLAHAGMAALLVAMVPSRPASRLPHASRSRNCLRNPRAHCFAADSKAFFSRLLSPSWRGHHPWSQSRFRYWNPHPSALYFLRRRLHLPRATPRIGPAPSALCDSLPPAWKPGIVTAHHERHAALPQPSREAPG